MRSDLELAREENMRLRRQAGALMVKRSEAIVEQMLLRAQLEQLQQEIEKLKAVKH